MVGRSEGGTVFLGTYAPKLDEKGRIILPAKFREELAGGVVMTRGQEHCVYVFSTREFEALHDKIRQAPVTSKQARDYLRVFLSGASAETPDKQNRITVPASLRSYAGLSRDLTVIGAGSVVTKDIPANVVAVGNPCRVVRPITDEDKLKSWDRE